MKTGLLSFPALLLFAASSFAAEPAALPLGVGKLLPGQNPWVVLGFVADFENEPIIDARGHELRKKVEALLQEGGATIMPLSMSERLKWEQLWSLPFKGRIPPELIEKLALAEKTNIITGSYPGLESSRLTFLVYDFASARSLIFHQEQEREKDANKPLVKTLAAPEKEASAKTHQRRRSEEGATASATDTLEPSREKPMATGNRSHNRRPTLVRLAEELKEDGNLARFQAQYKEKPRMEIEDALRKFLDGADGTVISARIMENQTMAYMLALLLPDKLELQESLLAEIAERREFLSDWNRSSH